MARLDRGAIEWLTDRILGAIARADTIDPTSQRFLLRRYTATGRDDLAEGLGAALAVALSEPRTSDDPTPWLLLFAEASSFCDDDRVRNAAAGLMESLCNDLHRTAEIGTTAATIEACLVASSVLESHESTRSSIDELERLVGAAYRPGEGMGRGGGESDAGRGLLADQVRVASALLTAYALSGRLPYSMLAEELMQFSQRTFRDEHDGGFFNTRAAATSEKPFVVNCEMARVFSRLDALRHDPDYRAVAVTASSADYARDAASTLASQTPNVRLRGLEAAAYGLALLDLGDDLQ